MTREELQELFDESDRIFGKPERFTKWRREVAEQEARFAREREKSRNLTDSEMARWRQYFEGLVASEHTAMGEERAREDWEFTSDVMAHVIAELRESIETDTQQALDRVRKQGEEQLAELRGVVDRLRSDLLALGAQQEDVRARIDDVGAVDCWPARRRPTGA